MIQNGLSFFPVQASTIASKVDALYFYLTGVSLFFATLIFFLVLFFAVKYRRVHPNETPKLIHGNLKLEIFWSVIPLLITMTFFGWSSVIFFENARPPENAMEVFVVGKQWMWKIQHPSGRREINELHVPVGQAVRLTMTSEDVIHSFFVPAFRTKMDVLPGRYTQAWFQATKVGEYHLFCAEYCGTKHSGMIGKVVVMEPEKYAVWLQGSVSNGSESMIAKGKKLFNQYSCITCHGDALRAPSLQGIYKKQVELEGGQVVKADENYLRESILNPVAKIVKGFEPLMPTYATQMNEEEVLQLIAYLKSLASTPAEAPAEAKQESRPVIPARTL